MNDSMIPKKNTVNDSLDTELGAANVSLDTELGDDSNSLAIELGVADDSKKAELGAANDLLVTETNLDKANSPMAYLKYRSLENTHVFLWLIKDFAWISGFKSLGMIMALPTISMAAYITYISRKENTSDFIHNIAVSCWILANVLWMTGEFYFKDEVRHWAIPFFVLGIATLLIFYGIRWMGWLKK